MGLRGVFTTDPDSRGTEPPVGAGKAGVLGGIGGILGSTLAYGFDTSYPSVVVGLTAGGTVLVGMVVLAYFGVE